MSHECQHVEQVSHHRSDPQEGRNPIRRHGRSNNTTSFSRNCWGTWVHIGQQMQPSSHQSRSSGGLVLKGGGQGLHTLVVPVTIIVIIAVFTSMMLAQPPCLARRWMRLSTRISRNLASLSCSAIREIPLWEGKHITSKIYWKLLKYIEIWRLIKILSSANGHSSRKMNLLSRIFLEPTFYSAGLWLFTLLLLRRIQTACKQQL